MPTIANSGSIAQGRLSRLKDYPMKYLTPRLAFALVLPVLLTGVGCSSSSSGGKKDTGVTGGSGGSGGAGGIDAAAGSGGSGGSGGTAGRDAGPQDAPDASDAARVEGGSDVRDGSTDLGEAGGMVAGPADMHCTGVDTITVAELSCHPDGGAAPPPVDDAGAEPEPPVHNNGEADDDDCKYHVRWTSTPVYKGMPVTFTVTVTNKIDNTPITFPPRAEFGIAGVLASDDTVVLPNTSPVQMLGSNGTWTYGPVRFDTAGDWKVTVHLREECSDNLEDSPHGHATFLVRVP
jgi:hypothetical protein